MKWIATIRPRAMTDLHQAHEWYEKQSPGLGDEFLADLAEAFQRLETNPEYFPLYYRDLRRVLARRFPYKIFFRISGQSLIVFRILHAAQDHPRKLRP